MYVGPDGGVMVSTRATGDIAALRDGNCHPGAEKKMILLILAPPDVNGGALNAVTGTPFM